MRTRYEYIKQAVERPNNLSFKMYYVKKCNMGKYNIFRQST
jgi:hypothetical protein